jgi:hypothetical protein
MDIIMTDEMVAKFREFYNNSSHNIPDTIAALANEGYSEWQIVFLLVPELDILF